MGYMKRFGMAVGLLPSPPVLKDTMETYKVDVTRKIHSYTYISARSGEEAHAKALRLTGVISVLGVSLDD